MDTSLFQTTELTQKKLDIWIKFGFNVMLVGEKGCGKSSRIIEAFNRNNLNWVYFSGATLDPWTDVIGIPKPKQLENGESIIEYIRPQNMNENVEAIFVDEYNRCHKKVKNSLMELIQFKSINGRPFPNLRLVWAAINPEDENESYDIEPLDPAQLDRFHVIVNVPYEPDKEYFRTKFGKTMGNQAVEWWNQQSEIIKKQISPRRLDYALDGYNVGVDIADILPRVANFNKLKNMINMTETQVIFDEAFQEGDTETQSEILNDDSKYEEIKKLVLFDAKYYITLSTLCHMEKLSAMYEYSHLFRAWVDQNHEVGQNKKFLTEKGILKKDGNLGILTNVQRILEGENAEKIELVTYCRQFLAYTEKHKHLSGDEYNNSIALKFKPKWKDFIDAFFNTKSVNISLSEINDIFNYLTIFVPKKLSYNPVIGESIRWILKILTREKISNRLEIKGIDAYSPKMSIGALFLEIPSSRDLITGFFENIQLSNTVGALINGIPL
jgi:hypothetical protein